jgi:putative toxin-antitoxin system antitoxin component (TIGR02293 family)
MRGHPHLIFDWHCFCGQFDQVSIFIVSHEQFRKSIMVSSSDRISALLGIKATNALALMSEVEKGLPSEALARVVKSIAPSDNQFAYKIVPRATLARRKANDATKWRLSNVEGTRLARLTSVWALALDVWGEAVPARRFMFEAHPLLKGRRPIDVVLESEFGRPVVEGILGRLKYGSAV